MRLAIFSAAVALTLSASMASAQRGCTDDSPATESEITIIATDEPGERLTVAGQVLGPDGPVGGAVVYAYQTDKDGYYAPGDAGASAARLCGRMLTRQQRSLPAQHHQAGRLPARGDRRPHSPGGDTPRRRGHDI